MADFWIPDNSSGEIVEFERLEATVPRQAMASWKALKGARRFPGEPDDVLAAVPHSAIVVRAIDGGADYEYCSVGDALVAGFQEDFSGRFLSDIIATTPRFGIGLRMLYEMVRNSGEPLFYRGWVGADMPGAKFVYYESAVLPFGGDALLVDHILVASQLILRDQAYPAMPQSLRA